jgi:hypothetical protein
MEINSIIICTVDREPEYIHQTITRLLFTLGEKKDIHLVVDGSSYKHYSTYKDFCDIHLREECSSDIVFKKSFKKAKNNYIRCLELSISLGGFNLILEDDVLLYMGWYEKIKSLESPLDDGWILSLNCIQGIDSIRGYEEFRAEKNDLNYLVTWCKPFGVIYKPEVLGFIINSLKFYSKDIPHDIIIGGILHNTKIKIYECVPTLIEHIGTFSAANKGAFWKTTKDVYGRFEHNCYPLLNYGN